MFRQLLETEEAWRQVILQSSSRLKGFHVYKCIQLYLCVYMCATHAYSFYLEKSGLDSFKVSDEKGRNMKINLYRSASSHVQCKKFCFLLNFSVVFVIAGDCPDFLLVCSRCGRLLQVPHWGLWLFQNLHLVMLICMHVLKVVWMVSIWALLDSCSWMTYEPPLAYCFINCCGCLHSC